MRDLRVLDYVCSEPGSAKDDVAIGGGIEHPRDATYVSLAGLRACGDLSGFQVDGSTAGGASSMSTSACGMRQRFAARNATRDLIEWTKEKSFGVRYLVGSRMIMEGSVW